MASKILVAMSGGVDSSVSAALLLEKGYEVAGLTMCLGTYAGDGSKKCCGPREIEDARRVCTALGIRHFVLDLSNDFEAGVISNFLSEYSRGRTPNPCIECNRLIKFMLLIKKASLLGYDLLATGHYAGIMQTGDIFSLVRPMDRKKDQTYFLYCIEPSVLKRCRFPLAEYTKYEVRTIAQKLELPVAEKPESQDICFITEHGLQVFLRDRLPEMTQNDIVDESGKIVGRHNGLCFYTIGQRQGLGISTPRPIYVTALETKRNRVFIGYKESLMARGLIAESINMFTESVSGQASAKIRYGHTAQACRYEVCRPELRVIFDQPQEAITPGQSVVLYDGEIVLGGGIIEKALKNEYS